MSSDAREQVTTEAHSRRRQMLLTAFGPVIHTSLQDPLVTDILVNPDGRLWIDKVGDGRTTSGTTLPSEDIERIIRLVASTVAQQANEAAPIVSAELPETGERFEGLLPPVAVAPCFAIRKPAGLIYTLEDYVTSEILSPAQRLTLISALEERQNIVVVGGTGSGKTTLVNALLAEIANSQDRILILEDTRELQCLASDVVALRTSPGVVSLADLVRSTLRLRPDRIIVGEVRGGEALDMLKAWNTGHPGGITTTHANSDRAALYRLEQLIQEAVHTVPRRLIADAIDTLVFIEGRGGARKVRTISRVERLNADGDYDLNPLAPVHLNAV